MALKKKTFAANEILIFEDAVIYLRGGYWHFRLWLAGEGKYVRESLKTKSKSDAIAKAKKRYVEIIANVQQGKTYFSITAKEGVEKYLAQRKKDVETKVIVPGRLTTISTHLKHWLKFIGPNTKIKDLDSTACEDYFHHRVTGKNKNAINQVTVKNEQSSINAMMKWLYKKKETNIDGFDFKKISPIDRTDDVRRATLTKEEVAAFETAVHDYIADDLNMLHDPASRTKVLISYYCMIAVKSGMRPGELMQLKWGDTGSEQLTVKRAKSGSFEEVDLVRINVRAETSKVRTSRSFYIRDKEYYDKLLKVQYSHMKTNNISDCYIFSLDGKTHLTQRVVRYHFKALLKLADVKGRDKRKLVPYSFRHTFITEMINAGATYAEAAQMCGTSVGQIEKTYFHLDQKSRLKNAMVGYVTKSDDLIMII